MSTQRKRVSQRVAILSDMWHLSSTFCGVVVDDPLGSKVADKKPKPLSTVRLSLPVNRRRWPVFMFYLCNSS